MKESGGEGVVSKEGSPRETLGKGAKEGLLKGPNTGGGEE